MRLLFIILLFSINASATNYYVKNGGSDVSNGLSDATAWATPAKAFATAASTDSVFFKRGNLWVVSTKLVPVADNIYFGAYGTGDKPLITGFETVTMTSAGGNIYTGTATNSVLKQNAVTVNGKISFKGRYPNATTLAIQGFVSKTKLKVLHSATNYTGSEVAIRDVMWVLDVCKVTSVSTGVTFDTLNLFPALTFGGGAGGTGYFFQNKSEYLDANNEYSYDSTTKLISVFATALPAVQYSTVDTLIYLANRNYLTFENLKITGSNRSAVELFTTERITFKNCTFDNHGASGISETYAASGWVKYTYLINDTITNCLSNGYYSDPSVSDSIVDCVFKNIGIYPGMGMNGNNSYSAIYSWGLPSSNAKSTFLRNKIDSVGYNGIRATGKNHYMAYNYVNTYCFVKDDGGAYYTYVGNGDQKLDSGSVWEYNYAANGIGAPDGGTDIHALGFYLDDGSSWMTLRNNTTYLSSGSYTIKGKYNTVVNNIGYTGIGAGLYADLNLSGHTFKNNILYRSVDIYASYVLVFAGNIPDATTVCDSNRYLMLGNPEYFIGIGQTKYTLPTWRAFSGYDINSTGIPSGITSAQPLLPYNPNNIATTYPLTGTYVNATGVNYTGSITLQPYTSQLLFKAITDIIPSNRTSIKIRLVKRN